MYSVSPPGLFYRDPPLSEGAHFTLDYDLESSVRAPVFLDGCKELCPAELDERCCLIVDIRSVALEKGVRDRRDMLCFDLL